MQISQGRGAAPRTLRGSFNTTFVLYFEFATDEWYLIYSENALASPPPVAGDLLDVSSEWGACIGTSSPAPSARPSAAPSTSVMVNTGAFTELFGMSCDYFSTSIGRQAFVSAVVSTQQNVTADDIVITGCEDVVDLRAYATTGASDRRLATIAARVFWVILLRVDTLGYLSEDDFMAVFASRFYSAVVSGSFVREFKGQDPSVGELYTGQDNTVFGPPPPSPAQTTSNSDALLSDSMLGLVIGLGVLFACCLLALLCFLCGCCRSRNRRDNKIVDESLVPVASSPAPVQAHGGPEARIFGRGRSGVYNP